MNIRQLILESTEIMNIIEESNDITLDFLVKCLGIELDILFELLENENVFIQRGSDTIISSDLLKQILLKEPDSISSPKNLKQLILSNENLLKRLEDDSKDFIRINLLCRVFQMGTRALEKLFASEGIVISQNPNYKIKKQILKDLIAINLKIVDNENELSNLKEKLITEEKVYTKSIVLNQFIRSEQIREYAKLRANGVCELCENEAPFKDKFGKPYLESHHIIFLSKGGKDSIENVAALCPNCHRKIHNLNLQTDVKKLLRKRNENT